MAFLPATSVSEPSNPERETAVYKVSKNMSAENFCKHFGPRSGPTECRAWSGSKPLDTMIEFKNEVFKKVDFEKKSVGDK